jgi:hypothetical protein
VAENIVFASKLFPFRANSGTYSEVIIEEQPYIANSQNATRNFKLHQVQMGLIGLFAGKDITVHRVSPRKARTELGICTGDYNLNKKLSIEFCKQKLGSEFKELPYALRNHAADTVMLSYWFISKKLGMEILDPNNGEPQHHNWIPPERRNNVKALHRSRAPSSPSQEGSGGSAEEQRDDEAGQQVRKQ